MKISLNDVVYNAKINQKGIVSLCVSDVEKEKLNFKDFSLFINNAYDILPLLSNIATKKQENFHIIALNSSRQVIKHKTLFKGTLNSCPVDLRLIFKFLLLNNATAFIVAHNHPSNNTEPSMYDVELTEKLKNASDMMGIQLLDHIIIGKYNFYSFSENRNIL